MLLFSAYAVNVGVILDLLLVYCTEPYFYVIGLFFTNVSLLHFCGQCAVTMPPT